MTLPPDFDVPDCLADEKALNAGGTAAAVRASPAHSRRLRRVSGAGSNVLDLLDLDFMRLAFCVVKLLVAPGKFHEERLSTANLLGDRFTEISRAGRPSNIRCAHFGTCQGRGNRSLDRIRTFFSTKMTKHHGT